MVETGGIMSERLIFPCEAVVIRYRPDPLAGESLNIGIVLVCEHQRFVRCKFVDQWGRITSAFPNTDFVHLRRIANALETESEKCAPKTKQASFDFPSTTKEFIERVFVPDDGSIQVSDTIAGVTTNPAQTLEALFDAYIGRYHKSQTKKSRTDQDVWAGFSKAHLKPEHAKRLKPKELKSENLTVSFEYSWKNGHINVLQALSLDMQDTREIIQKGQIWFANAALIQPTNQNAEINLLVGMPPVELANPPCVAAKQALSIMRKVAQGVSIYTEDQAGLLAGKIGQALEEHPQDEELISY